MKMRAFRFPVLAPAAVAAGCLLAFAGVATAQVPALKAPGAGQMPVVQSPTDAAKPASSTGTLFIPTIPPGSGFNFESKVGSFKLLGSEETPVQGKLKLTFTGTVLISAMDPRSTIEITPGIRKEYTTKDGTKVVYFGSGKMTLTGKLRALQFFGRDVAGNFEGVGIFRLYGEFDTKLQTGFYWFDNEPDSKKPWGSGGMALAVPNQASTDMGAKVKIKN